MPSAKTKFVCAALSFRRLRGTSAYPPRLAVKADIPDRQVRARKRHMHRSKTASSFDRVVHADEHQPIAERNYGTREACAYSGLMLAARITLAHFSVSSAMSLPKSAGVRASMMPPRSLS